MTAFALLAGEHPIDEESFIYGSVTCGADIVLG